MGFIWAALDESADREQRHVFVVAGYVSRQSNWTETERKWMLRLEKESDPEPMKYFSNSECMSLSGEFARFRDKTKYPKPRGRLAAGKVKDDLQDIMKEAPAAGFALGVLMQDYRAVRRSSRARTLLGTHPYEQTYALTMICIAGNLEDEMPSREVVAYLCDEHDKAVNVRNVYEELKRQNPACGRWMRSLSYMNNKKSPALQAADLLAARCKDYLVKMVTNRDIGELRDKFKSEVGRDVSIKYLDKASLQLLVDANLLKGAGPASTRLNS